MREIVTFALPAWVLVAATLELWPRFRHGGHAAARIAVAWVPIVFLSGLVMRSYPLPWNVLIDLLLIVVPGALGFAIVGTVERRRLRRDS